MKIKNKTAGHAGIACFSFALKGNRAGSPHFKIVRFKWWEHVTTVVGNMPGYEGISIYLTPFEKSFYYKIQQIYYDSKPDTCSYNL